MQMLNFLHDIAYMHEHTIIISTQIDSAKTPDAATHRNNTMSCLSCEDIP